ncbi:DDE-domain-containing protein, partial [Didymella exigua CBS 183.55]
LKVVTGLERRAQLELVQPGDREWVTIIQSICAARYATLPFIIYKGRVYISAYSYARDHSSTLRSSLQITLLCMKKVALRVLKHFNKHTKARTFSSHQLLILDGHESHNLVEFHQYCEEHKIITLCIPPHSSHLLQPLDVGCFALLKKAYGRQAKWLMRSRITYITKLKFLLCFKAAFDALITESNI